MGKMFYLLPTVESKTSKSCPPFHKPCWDIWANSIFITADSPVQSKGRGNGEWDLTWGERLKRHDGEWVDCWGVFEGFGEQSNPDPRSKRPSALSAHHGHEFSYSFVGVEHSIVRPPIYCSLALKIFSFSFWAVSKASLKRLASNKIVNHDLFIAQIELV